MNGVDLISIERCRQIDALGYSADHDDDHTDGSIGIAAVCYALLAQADALGGADWLAKGMWPWESPIPRAVYAVFDRDHQAAIDHLVKAGALLAAEIDRRLRAMGEGA